MKVTMRNAPFHKLVPANLKVRSINPEPRLPPLDYEPPKYQGPSFDSLIKTRRASLSPSLFTVYEKPLIFHDGKGQYLFDHTGKRYLDMFAGIVTVSVGHCNPKVVEATKEQLDKLWHTSNLYLHPTIHQYAEALAATLPEKLKVVHFVNSGSEANDLALMMARVHTGRFDTVTFRNSYHGASAYTAGLSGTSKSKFIMANGCGIHHVMNPDPYRGLWGGYRDSPVQSLRAMESELLEGGTMCSSTPKYIEQLRELLDFCVHQGKPAAFFAESIQGVGGVVQFPLGYLKEAFAMIRDRGGLCVSDEVQTGFGRTGEHFWGFEAHDVVPDIVTMAKGIGNGYPLAAVVTTQEVSDTLLRASHFNTYGGNALGSAVGLAVLNTMKEENVQKLSHELGTYFLKELERIRHKYDCVGDVRGKGLMIGVELVESKSNNKFMNPERFTKIWERCREMGLIVGRGGDQANVFRVKPPMCITKADVDFAIEVMTVALDEDKEEYD